MVAIALGLFAGRDLAVTLAEILVHHGTAAGGEIRAMLDHAGGDLGNVGNFRTAEAEGVAGAHLLRLRGVGEARVR